ncbi:uncharacterized protein G2W53_016913 [Senna tora]|uniref:Uncharacterized protein n=1 Tax=Senna tora TaxID=362788 RepID=A0A834TXA0_9FABA|nr:uncharacterized protein G2W53_016913 [Senna tora]
MDSSWVLDPALTYSKGEEVQRCDREGDREEIGRWRRLTLGGKREKERERVMGR